MISARSRPARMSPTPANDAVPRKTAAIASGHVWPAGFHPRRRPIGKRTAACKSSTTNTERIFAITNCDFDSGVAPRRLRTRYDRSKPVAIPRLTIEVLMMATARTPGTRKFNGSVSPLGNTSTEPKNASRIMGIISVRRSCSPLRASNISSARSCNMMRFIDGRLSSDGMHLPKTLDPYQH